MSRNKQLRQKVAGYIFGMFEDLHYQKTSRISMHPIPPFTDKVSIVNAVYESGYFVDSSKHHAPPKLLPNQVLVSPTTVMNAINDLIAAGYLTLGENGYEHIPRYNENLKHYPILDIAPQIDISFGIPENLLILTVQNGAATSVAEYLSAFFYKGDIIFIPIGNNILCIGVLSNHYATKLDKGETIPLTNHSKFFKFRIESALHKFNCHYPKFGSNDFYDIAYTARHTPEVIASLKEQADTLPKDISQIGSTPFYSFYQTLNLISKYDNVSDDDDSIDYDADISGYPTQEELDDFTYLPEDDKTREELEKFRDPFNNEEPTEQ